jgi:hypothetical protein
LIFYTFNGDVKLMAQSPAFLDLSEVKCITTDDAVGRDDVYVRFKDINSNDVGGGFNLGLFNAGDTSGREVLIPAGAVTLELWESDTFTADDLIGAIDLTEDMDVERSVTLTHGSAEYALQLQVGSQSD